MGTSFTTDNPREILDWEQAVVQYTPDNVEVRALAFHARGLGSFNVGK